MDVRAAKLEFETCRVETRRRVCPGCGRAIDLGSYGCVAATATVVCPGCGQGSRVGDLPRE